MRLDELKEQVLEANRGIVAHGLAQMTWGNVSGIDRERELVAIKPSGVPYSALDVDAIVVVDLDGRIVEGRLKPSSDMRTHVLLYRAFAEIGGITHTHSARATAFAQAGREIPCLGTTHADHFCGPVPVTRAMTPAETAGDYERETGAVIVERFAGLDPMAIPAVLVAHHGPFTWGADALGSLHNAIALEAVADMALSTLALATSPDAVPAHLLDRHFSRKHGPDAYYGNPDVGAPTS